MIAHRLSTIQRVSRILVLDKGTLAESGTPQELRSRQGYYARMVSGQMNGNYLSPEFQEFIRAELLRTGKAIRTIATALENDNEQVKTQAQTALTAQFFYALGLLYTRGVIIPRDVPGASTRAEDVTATVAAESFGESLERFAREPLQFRSSTLGELIEKARVCFRVLSSEGEQLERFKEDRFKIEKKRVTA